MSTAHCDYDCLVIGAGMAGLAAGQVLNTIPELRFGILEARERIGGRVLSLDDFGTRPLELGAEWLHAADANPLLARFEALGVRVSRESPAWGAAAAAQGLSPHEIERCAAALAAGEAALREAGRAVRDQALSECLPAAAPYQGLFAALLSFMSGGPAAAVSAQDFATFRDTGVDWPVKDGLGAALRRLAHGLPISLNVRLEAVDLSTQGLRLKTCQGELSARCVILCLPLGVLQAEAVRFRPELPDAHREALLGLAPGAAEKFVLALNRSTLGLPPGTALYSRGNQAECAYVRLLDGQPPVVLGLIAGSLAEAVGREGEDAVLAYARDELAELFGHSVRRELGLGLASGWLCDPLTRGAYSYARPGAQTARAALALPIQERLWLAGEALDRTGAGALHGAYASGERAARAVLRQLGHELPSSETHEHY